MATPSSEVPTKRRQTRFYTGVPARTDNLGWHRFWEAKLRAISRQGVQVYSRPLRFRLRTVKLPDGAVYGFRTGEEKGIDVRIALDIASIGATTGGAPTERIEVTLADR